MVPFIKKLEELVGYTFNNRKLLETALTHPSYAAEQKGNCEHNQRMEFLGDAVLEMVVTRELYLRFPDLQEGPLSKMRSALTNQHTLARLAKAASLDEGLLLGHGEEKGGGAARPSNLCDAFESFLAAVYLDSNIEEVERIFWNLCEKEEIDAETITYEFNPKGALQEFIQSRFHKRPVYRTEKVEGPVHDPLYTISVSFQDRVLAVEQGSNRKHTESKAAREALRILMREEREGEKEDDAK